MTVMMQGELEHRDSMGNKGLLRAGDVQRLTSGSGVVHDEGPSPNMKKLGGTIESFQVSACYQLWAPKASRLRMC